MDTQASKSEPTSSRSDYVDADHRSVLPAIPSILIGVEPDGSIAHWNDAAAQAFGLNWRQVLHTHLQDLPVKWQAEPLLRRMRQCLDLGTAVRVDDFYYERLDGKLGCLGLTLTPYVDQTGSPAVLILGADVSERKLLEAQLAQAQKLESIGQLAAGIAHEINTPTQYVGDNLRFLMRTFESLRPALEAVSKLADATPADCASLIGELRSGLDGVNLGFILEEFPNAMAESADGIKRVADIVRAMKEFSHPGSEEKGAVDINRAVSSTVTVARNEWKYVAEMDLELDPDLPAVPCIPNEFNQTMLNLVVNAAHAIAEAVGETGEMGRIGVMTRLDGEWAEISVSDSGCGIPEENLTRIFDPFFTTKEVGRGTGQGLALVHSSVVKRHGGGITVQSRLGIGTTFTIRLPLREGVELAA